MLNNFKKKDDEKDILLGLVEEKGGDQARRC